MFGMMRQALKRRGTIEESAAGGGLGCIRVMALAAGIDIVFGLNIEVATGSFSYILIAAPTKRRNISEHVIDA